MRDVIYLIVDSSGVRNMRKSRPTLRGGEVAVALEVTVPQSYFNRSVPRPQVTLPEPTDLSADDVAVTLDNVTISAEVGPTDGEGADMGAGQAG